MERNDTFRRTISGELSEKVPFEKIYILIIA